MDNEKTCRYGNVKVILNDQRNNLRRQGGYKTLLLSKVISISLSFQEPILYT
jgi:hypothetical protein